MLWIIYALVSILHVAAIALEQQTLLYISKPLLMPILMCIIWTQTKLKTPLSKILFAGVFMGWLGDNFLMGSGVLFFSGGLVSFLIGHLMYIYLFSREVSDAKQTHYIMEKPYLILPFIAFWIYTICLIGTQENDLPKFPVYVYAFVICLMSIMAINRKYIQESKFYTLIIIGSILFIGSDFMIAINKFVEPFPNHRIYIMSTYTLAQGIIVYGCLKNNRISGKVILQF